MTQTGMTSGNQAGLSKREAADRAASIAAEETLVRNNPSPAARTSMAGSFSRVRDRQQAQEAMKPVVRKLSPAELAAKENADGWMAMHERWQREDREREQRQRQRVIDRDNAAKVAQERRVKQAAYRFQEQLLEDVFLRHAATNEDRRIVNGNLAARGLFGDLDATEVELQRVQLERR